MWPLRGYTMGVKNRSLFITKGGGGKDGRVEDLVVSQ